MADLAVLGDEEKTLPVNEPAQKAGQTLVGWDGDDDPDNPQNWSTGYKSWVTFQLGMIALAASLGSSIIAPAEPAIAKYVGVGKEVAVLSISLFL